MTSNHPTYLEQYEQIVTQGLPWVGFSPPARTPYAFDQAVRVGDSAYSQKQRVRIIMVPARDLERIQANLVGLEIATTNTAIDAGLVGIYAGTIPVITDARHTRLFIPRLAVVYAYFVAPASFKQPVDFEFVSFELVHKLCALAHEHGHVLEFERASSTRELTATLRRLV